MATNQTDAAKASRFLSVRRLVLLTSVAALAGTALFAGIPSGPKAGFLSLTPAYGESLARPSGFAEIVDRVKPSVISVRVKVDAESMSYDDDQSTPNGSPFEHFFRQFGQPNGGMPHNQHPRGSRRNRRAAIDVHHFH